ncbi:MAG: inositol monophosphatase family protein [bacterium]
MQDAILAAMKDAVLKAAVATRFVHASTAIDGVSKDDKSPVTVADWSSQAVVSLELARAGYGAIPLVGEEEAATLRTPESAALRARVVEAVGRALGPVTEAAVLTAIDRGRATPDARFFTLDPVDGTKGFLRRQQYAISLALLEGGHVVAGVVGCPNLPATGTNYDEADALGTLAWATRGGGAFGCAGDQTARAQRLSIAAWRAGSPVRACESVESGHSKQDLSAELLTELGSPGTPARLDSQSKYVVVARGGADAYLRLPTKKDYREKIWDHAAGALVASEAGARVCDVDGKPLDFGHGRELTANRGVFAGHPEAVALLVDAFRRRGL